ncbi:thrombospondin type 3 repeat-containing protein [Amycolatopsis anabasis]|uniref:thrombospondin type 3 repeat-containing protein n=1 Tax=Amycolatopsis anabasis TaxID=1840409 RepID=UPI00131E5DBD|nr:thrombospondin type 3 repeat-containing protein [Amycolatopsis anabasis]
MRYQNPLRRPGLTAGVLAASTALFAALAALPAASAAPAPVKCDLWGCSNDQPRVSVPVPPPAVPGRYAYDDFDHDGVANKFDNCLLVPNQDQQPAVRPAGTGDDPLAVQWKQQHPGAAFRLNSELGEACSGWNGNWHRSQKAQMIAPEPLKQKLYKYLGEGGPMFGNDTLVHGGPVCTNANDGWVNMVEYFLGFPEVDFPLPEKEFDCSTGAITNFIEAGVTAHVWGGKRLFTPTNEGGTITNRFFPSITEQPWFKPIVDAFPDIFKNGRPQTVFGHVIRGDSYQDGRSTIIMDWREVTGANLGGFPLPNVKVPFFASILVYDECRALQEGIWTCNANADLVKPSGDRKLFQFGWMMWQSNDPDLQAWEAWEKANPKWTKPETYGFTA